MDTERPDEGGSLGRALSAFVGVRPRLFGLAYRMLGSAADAEDIVQSAWLRWQTTDRTAVDDAPAFLTTLTARLAINLAASARSRRETYVGPWLPEPADAESDPRLGAERDDGLALAVRLLLENLTPAERAAFVLREAFNYPYGRIADVLRLNEANIRQLVSRARKHLQDGPRTTARRADQEHLLSAFVAAARDGNAAALEAVFAEDAASRADDVRAVRRRDGAAGGFAAAAVSAPRIDSQLWAMRLSTLAAISLALHGLPPQ